MAGQHVPATLMSGPAVYPNAMTNGVCPFYKQTRVIHGAWGFRNLYKNVEKTDAQVLKANMKIVGNCEYGLVLYKDKLPKFNNDGQMIFNCFDWVRDNETPKVHPTQKPVPLLERLIEIFTDEGDVVIVDDIDPCAGSGTTLLAAMNKMRRAYGFEIKKDFYKEAKEKVLRFSQPKLF